MGNNGTDYNYMKGDKNPAKTNEIRDKISIKLKGRKITWADKISHALKKSEKAKLVQSVNIKKMHDKTKGKPTWNSGLTKYNNKILFEMGLKKVEFYKNYPEKHANYIMARNKTSKGFISKPQLFLHSILGGTLEFPVVTDERTRYCDIAFIDTKLDIEYDEPRWHNSIADEQRDWEMINLGWTVIRITPEDVKELNNGCKLI